MKIERISDNQIRCTLNKEDLEGKETLLSELAFGSEKAKGSVPGINEQSCY